MSRADFLSSLFLYFSFAFPNQYSAKSLQQSLKSQSDFLSFFSGWKLLRCLVSILRRWQGLKPAMSSLTYNYCPRASQVFRHLNI